MTVAHPLIIGHSTGPEELYPLRMEGKVIRGFGRGSRDLGFPTANLPVDDKTPGLANIKSGVYFGWASLRLPPSHPNQPTPTSSGSTATAASGFSVYPMVMSIGCNDFYNNTAPSVEVHLLHDFEADFYGAEMRVLITGFIREMRDYARVEDLIEDIKMDCDVARRSLDRKAWTLQETGNWLLRETAEAE